MTKSTQLIFEKPLHVGYEDTELPPPGPGQVLCRSVISGISHGTEMLSYIGGAPFLDQMFTGDRIFRAKQAGDPPFYPFRWAGYDCVAVVEAVGPGVDRLSVGQRVWYQTPHRTAFMVKQDDPTLLALSDAVRDEDAIMINLASVSLGALLDAQVKTGDVVTVFGAGLVGIMAADLAVVDGAVKVFVVDPMQARLRRFEGRTDIIGVDPAKGPAALAIRKQNDGRDADVVIECSGAAAGLQDAIRCAGLGGTVIAAGAYAGDNTALHFCEEFLHNRVTVKASMSKWGCPSRYDKWNEARLLRTVLHLLETGKLNLRQYVSAKFPFREAQKAYEAIRLEKDRYLKIALTY